MARALQARGIVTVIVAPGIYRQAIEAESIAYAVLRPDESDIMQALGVDVAAMFAIMLKNPDFLDEIYLRFLDETHDDVMAATRGADVLIKRKASLSARIRLRRRSASLAPASPSRHYTCNPTRGMPVGGREFFRQAIR